MCGNGDSSGYNIIPIYILGLIRVQSEISVQVIGLSFYNFVFSR